MFFILDWDILTQTVVLEDIDGSVRPAKCGGNKGMVLILMLRSSNRF